MAGLSQQLLNEAADDTVQGAIMKQHVNSSCVEREFNNIHLYLMKKLISRFIGRHLLYGENNDEKMVVF